MRLLYESRVLELEADAIREAEIRDDWTPDPPLPDVDDDDVRWSA